MSPGSGPSCLYLQLTFFRHHVGRLLVLTVACQCQSGGYSISELVRTLLFVILIVIVQLFVVSCQLQWQGEWPSGSRPMKHPFENKRYIHRMPGSKLSTSNSFKHVRMAKGGAASLLFAVNHPPSQLFRTKEPMR